MAKLQKIAFLQDLDEIQSFITEEGLLSKYFNITDLPLELPMGKSSMLIMGSPALLDGVILKIELVDSLGEPVYIEPVYNYSESGGVRVGIEVYKDTAAGAATLTILGELDPDKVDENIPDQWRGTYNVKYTRTLTINKSIPNDRPIRFFKRPRLQVFEIIKGQVSLAASTTGSNEQTVGTIIGTPVQNTEGSNFSIDGDNYQEVQTYADQVYGFNPMGNYEEYDSTDPRYTITIADADFSSSIVGGAITIDAPNVNLSFSTGSNTVIPKYTSRISNVVNKKTIEVQKPYGVYDSGSGFYRIAELGPSSYKVNWPKFHEYDTSSINFKSFADIRLSKLRNFSGDVHRIAGYVKNNGPFGNWSKIIDTPVESPELLLDPLSITGTSRIGFFNSDTVATTYWTATGGKFGVESATTVQTYSSNEYLTDSIFMSGSNVDLISDDDEEWIKLQLKDAFKLDFIANTEYKLRIKLVADNTEGQQNKIKAVAHMSGSAFGMSQNNIFAEQGYGRAIGMITHNNSAGNVMGAASPQYETVFTPDSDGTAVLQLRFTGGYWSVSEISVKPNSDTNFSPEYIRLIAPVPPLQTRPDYLDFAFEFYDINNNKSQTVITSLPDNPDGVKFDGENMNILGNDNLIGGSVYIGGDSIGAGIQFGGVNSTIPETGGSGAIASGFIRSVKYQGFTSASQDNSNTGFMIYSGSVLPDSGDDYSGVGLELVGESGSFRFGTNPSRFEVIADAFFVGSTNAQFISGSGGNIEISSSAFHLTPAGDVIMSGSVTATEGYIGDWQIIEGKLSGSNATLDADGAALYKSDAGPDSNPLDGYYIDFTPGSYYVRFGTDFAVSSSGQLFASGAKIEGVLTSSEGYIGNWTIAPNTLHYFTDPTYTGLSSAGDTRFFAGATSLAASGSAPFNVKASGDITGSKVLFTGGKIAAFNISDDALYTDSFFISASATNDDLFISASNFNVSAKGDVSASDIYVSGGTTVGGDIIGGGIAGWSISATSIVDDNNIVKLEPAGAYIISSSNFQVSSAGEMTASAGKIAGFEINGTQLKQGTSFFLDGASDGSFFISSSDFQVTPTGQITASEANITGDITANTITATTAGNIANFTVASTGLTSTGVGMHPAGQAHAFTAGTGGTPAFSVTHAGQITASAANITGDIVANTITANTTGTIANFDIDSIEIASSNNKLRLKSSGQITASAAKISGSGVEIAAPSFILDTDNFDINSTIGTVALGTTPTLTGGTGVFMSSSGEFRLGDPSSYLSFVNDAFTLAGSDIEIDVTDLNISASGFTLSSPEASMSLGNSRELLLHATGGTNNVPIIKLDGGEISASNFFVSTAGEITASAGTIGGWSMTSASIESSNKDIQIFADRLAKSDGSGGPGFIIRDQYQNDVVSIVSGSLYEIGAATDEAKNDSFEVIESGWASDGYHIGNSASPLTIHSWSFSAIGPVSHSITRRSGTSFTQFNKALVGDYTFDIVRPGYLAPIAALSSSDASISASYAAAKVSDIDENQYTLSQEVSASSQATKTWIGGNVISFAFVGKMSHSLAGSGYDRGLESQKYKVDYWSTGDSEWKQFIPAKTGSDGFGSYDLATRYTSVKSSNQLPESTHKLRIVLSGSINSDIEFKTSEDLYEELELDPVFKYMKDAGLLPEPVTGSAANVKPESAKYPYTELSFDNFRLVQDQPRIQISQTGFLLYQSENSYLKMTPAGMDMRSSNEGGMAFGKSVTGRSAMGGAGIFGRFAAPKLQAYDADPNTVETYAFAGNTDEYARGNHAHILPFDTVSEVLQTSPLTEITLTTPTIGSFTNSTHTHANAAGGGQITLGTGTTGNYVATTIAGAGIDVTGATGNVTISIGSTEVTNTMLAGSIANTKLATNPLARANHTGTQAASTISDFDTEVSNNVTVASAYNSGATRYTHPTHDGDDISIDTTALTGATVVSDLDFNVTTDTSGHVTDANGAISTRTLTLANLGYMGETDATADQTAAEILTAIKTVDGASSALDADLLDGQHGSYYIARGNHTGTQVVSTISDFDTEVASNTAVAANTLKVSDVNHNVTTNLSVSRDGTKIDVVSSDGTNAVLPLADTDNWGVMSDEMFDEHVVNNAKVSDVNHNVTTNLSVSRNGTKIDVVSSDGTNAVLPLADTNNWGVMSDEMFDEHVVNNAKVSDVNHNVTTNLSVSRDGTKIDVVSSDGTNAVLPLADTDNWGVMSDEMFDEHVVNNAKVSDINHNVTTNLSVSRDGTKLDIVSSDGTNAVLPLADTTNWGVMSDEMFDKLDGIETSATADQDNAEIRAAVEAATNSNVFTDTDHSHLDAIEASATADQTAAEILTAIKTVDGASSALDADLLDGQHGSYYTDFSNITVTSGEVSNTMLANSSINFGGISLSLGDSDTTPAFALADAIGLPIVAGTTGTLSVARGGTGVTSKTGTGNVVLSASPTLTETLNLSKAAGANIRFDNPTTSRYFTIGEGVGTTDKFSFRGNSYRSTDTLTVDFANNRVGIATISPAEALDVVGDIKASVDIHSGEKVYVGTNLRLGGGGNANDPAITTSGDTNTGIYFGTNKVGIGGSVGLEVEAGATFGNNVGVTGNITVTGTVDTIDIATRDGVLTSTTATANSALQPADTMYIGTTSIAFNRANAALTLAGITLTTPTLVTPVLGTPGSGNFSTGTFTWPTFNQSTTGNAATVTTNANLTGDVTSVGNATVIAADVIIDADVKSDAAIAYSKLGTVPTWNQNTTGTAANATLAAAVTVTDDSSTNTDFAIPYHNGSNALLDDTGVFTYNPNTQKLIVPNIDISGIQTLVNTATLVVTSSVTFEGESSDDFETNLGVTNPTEDRTITLPNASGNVVLDTLEQTLTNKTLTSPDINSPDIDGGNIDGSTIATSNVTVGSGKTLNVSGGTLTTSAAQKEAIMEGAGANIDIGAYSLTAQTLVSDVAIGTPPLAVTSTTEVSNLNAAKLSGADWDAPLAIGGTTAAAGTFTTGTFSGNINANGNIAGDGSTAMSSMASLGIGTVTATGLLTGVGLTTTGAITATGQTIGSAAITSTGLITGVGLTTTGAITATGQTIGSAAITSTGLLTGVGLTTTGAITATGQTIGSAAITSTGLITGVGLTTTGAITATGQTIGSGAITSTGLITGVGLTTTGAITATGQTIGSGAITSTGAIIGTSYTGGAISGTTGNFTGDATFSEDIILDGTGDTIYNSFISGIMGTGWRIDYDTTNGGSHLEIDNITVRNTLQTHIFQKGTVKATNGYLYISDSGVISGSVSASNYVYIIDEKSATFIADDRLWFKSADITGSGTINSVKFDIAAVTADTPQSGVTRYTVDNIEGDIDNLTVGGTVVKISGGSILLDASSANGPYMDIVNGLSVSGSATNVAVRTGNLAGITTANAAFGSSGTLSGFGMWASGSVYLEGGINATEGLIAGWSINDETLTGGNLTLDKSGKIITSDGSNERVWLGLIDTDPHYGLKIFDGVGTADANRLVELGSGDNMIAGWDLVPGNIQSDNAGGSVRLSSVSQSLTIWTGSMNEAEPKLVLGKLPLNDGTVDSPYGFAVFSGSGTVSGSEANASILITANKARLAGWDLSPGKLESGTVAVIDGNQGKIALGTNATLATSAAPSASLFFVSASADPIFYVGQNFSYVSDVLTAGGWTIGSGVIESLDTDGGIKIDASNKQINIYTGSAATTTPRIVIGDVNGSDSFGIKGVKSNGNTVFEISETQNIIAGWTINAGAISKNSVKLDSTSGEEGLYVLKNGYTSATAGAFLGIDDGEGKFNVGDSSKFIKFDGSDFIVEAGNFSLDASGNMTAESAQFSGSIQATGGKFTGNVTAGTTTINAGGITGSAGGGFRMGNEGLVMGGGSITLGSNFAVDSSGNMIASNVVLSGEITAETGSIGGWNVTSNQISSSTGTVKLISENGGALALGSTPPASHTSGIGVFVSGSGQTLIGDADGSRIQYDGSNLIMSASTFHLGGPDQFISGSDGNLEISSSNFHLSGSGAVTAQKMTLEDYAEADYFNFRNVTIQCNDATEVGKYFVKYLRGSTPYYALIINGSRGGHSGQFIRLNYAPYLAYPIGMILPPGFQEGHMVYIECGSGGGTYGYFANHAEVTSAVLDAAAINSELNTNVLPLGFGTIQDAFIATDRYGFRADSDDVIGDETSSNGVAGDSFFSFDITLADPDIVAGHDGGTYADLGRIGTGDRYLFIKSLFDFRIIAVSAYSFAPSFYHGLSIAAGSGGLTIGDNSLRNSTFKLNVYTGSAYIDDYLSVYGGANVGGIDDPGTANLRVGTTFVGGNITSLTPFAKISGSSTSTGSFGSVQVRKNINSGVITSTGLITGVGLTTTGAITATDQTIGSAAITSTGLITGVGLTTTGAITATGQTIGSGAITSTGTVTGVDGIFSGDLTVTGKLNITGDIDSYNVTDLDVVDKTITLGAGQIEANSGGSGIVIDGSSASMLWDETNTEWDFNNSINVTGAGTFSGNINANGNIVGDGSTAISGMASLGIGSVTATGGVTAEHFHSTDDAVIDDDLTVKGSIKLENEWIRFSPGSGKESVISVPSSTDGDWIFDLDKEESGTGDLLFRSWSTGAALDMLILDGGTLAATFTGDINANGNIVGDGSTAISGMASLGIGSVTATGNINANGNIVGDGSTAISSMASLGIGSVTATGTVTGVTGTFSGNINANGNIVGDGSTAISGMASLGIGSVTATGLITGTDLTISGTSTTIGTVTSGIWNAGAVTSTGIVSGLTGAFMNSLGIGTSTPEGFVNITNGGISAFTAVENPANYHMFLQGSSTTNKGVGIAFGNSAGNVGSAIIYKDVGGWAQGGLEFYTKASTSDGAAPIKRMTINYSGGFGVGATPAATAGHIRASNDIVAFYSDERLKEKITIGIENPIDKIKNINTFTYRHNELANTFGFVDDKIYIGVGAQSVKEGVPEAVEIAPFDADEDGNSKSGEDYLTVQYERLVPLLIEGMKDQQKQIEDLQQQIEEIKNGSSINR